MMRSNWWLLFLSFEDELSTSMSSAANLSEAPSVLDNREDLVMSSTVAYSSSCGDWPLLTFDLLACLNNPKLKGSLHVKCGRFVQLTG